MFLSFSNSRHFGAFFGWVVIYWNCGPVQVVGLRGHVWKPSFGKSCVSDPRNPTLKRTWPKSRHTHCGQKQGMGSVKPEWKWWAFHQVGWSGVLNGKLVLDTKSILMFPLASKQHFLHESASSNPLPLLSLSRWDPSKRSKFASHDLRSKSEILVFVVKNSRMCNFPYFSMKRKRTSWGVEVAWRFNVMLKGNGALVTWDWIRFYSQRATPFTSARNGEERQKTPWQLQMEQNYGDIAWYLAILCHL